MNPFLARAAAALLLLAAASGCDGDDSSSDGGTGTDSTVATDVMDPPLPDACPAMACPPAACGMIDDGCGGMLMCTACDGGAASCTVTGTLPFGVASCTCVMSTSDTDGGCCEEGNAWLAADKTKCGSNLCEGPCEPFCSCYALKCTGKMNCP